MVECCRGNAECSRVKFWDLGDMTFIALISGLGQSRLAFLTIRHVTEGTAFHRFLLKAKIEYDFSWAFGGLLNDPAYL
jgi:hypothetical protein